MEQKLRAFEQKRVDINCGTGAIFRGVVREVDDKWVAVLDEDEQLTYIAIKKIIAVTECADPVSRPGFIV